MPKCSAPTEVECVGPDQPLDLAHCMAVDCSNKECEEAGMLHVKCYDLWIKNLMKRAKGMKNFSMGAKTVENSLFKHYGVYEHLKNFCKCHCGVGYLSKDFETEKAEKKKKKAAAPAPASAAKPRLPVENTSKKYIVNKTIANIPTPPPKASTLPDKAPEARPSASKAAEPTRFVPYAAYQAELGGGGSKRPSKAEPSEDELRWVALERVRDLAEEHKDARDNDLAKLLKALQPELHQWHEHRNLDFCRGELGSLRISPKKPGELIRRLREADAEGLEGLGCLLAVFAVELENHLRKLRKAKKSDRSDSVSDLGSKGDQGSLSGEEEEGEELEEVQEEPFQDYDEAFYKDDEEEEEDEGSFVVIDSKEERKKTLRRLSRAVEEYGQTLGAYEKVWQHLRFPAQPVPAGVFNHTKVMVLNGLTVLARLASACAGPEPRPQPAEEELPEDFKVQPAVVVHVLKEDLDNLHATLALGSCDRLTETEEFLARAEATVATLRRAVKALKQLPAKPQSPAKAPPTAKVQPILKAAGPPEEAKKAALLPTPHYPPPVDANEPPRKSLLPHPPQLHCAAGPQASSQAPLPPQASAVQFTAADTPSSRLPSGTSLSFLQPPVEAQTPKARAKDPPAPPAHGPGAAGDSLDHFSGPLRLGKASARFGGAAQSTSAQFGRSGSAQMGAGQSGSAQWDEEEPYTYAALNADLSEILASLRRARVRQRNGH